MWLVRILVTLIFQILWVRKNKKNHAKRFCLSFFCEIEGLDFSSFALEKDPYLYFWILYFKPILDFWNTYDLFIEKNSSWADFSEFENIIKNNKKYIKFTKKTPLSAKGEGLGMRANNLFKKIFLPRTLKHFNKINKPYWIIISDVMLKFHNWDIREQTKKELV
jgi:hypothetical protein